MGKSGATEAPPAPMSDNSGDMEMMMAMMNMMSQQQAPMPQLPPPIPTPEVATTDPVDWSSQMDSLKNEARYKYNEQERNRKSRLSTIHNTLTDDDPLPGTSLLADDKTEE